MVTTEQKVKNSSKMQRRHQRGGSARVRLQVEVELTNFWANSSICSCCLGDREEARSTSALHAPVEEGMEEGMYR